MVGENKKIQQKQLVEKLELFLQKDNDAVTPRIDFCIDDKYIRLVSVTKEDTPISSVFCYFVMDLI